MGLMRRRAAHPDAAAAADTVLRLAVLLRAGLAPSRAWIVLDDGGDPVAARVRTAVARGDDVSDALAAEGGTWKEIAAAWRVATTVGAPLSESLRDVAAALRDGQRTADDVRVALAEPASTARLLGWLPLVAVLLGLALGFDTALVLATTPFGIACLVAGVALMVLAHRWNAALVRRAAAAPGIPGMAAELTAIALAGGSSTDRARELVREATSGAADPDVDEVLALSRAAGVPAVELLRSSAWLARHRARTDGRLRAARLSSQLLLPLGVCTLPSFLLLGVAPMMLSILSSGVLTL
ncbi:type II secretion system F family protein [Microbacterium lushaniae]|uniref:Type II secretion system F family protein n=1 Tax=Microbacterium lushaniae TaxID=2614639 RepID=A0A5J6L656_9MICO|nr:type II secretion system F family protein [Microbacterium lushaniae]QEW03895.1 type II secretion system F family protein [Microbacterium lushaniae]